jgi:hypothetical protein
MRNRIFGVLVFIGAALWSLLWEFVRSLFYEHGSRFLNPFIESITLDQIIHWGPPIGLTIVGLWLFWKTRPKNARRNNTRALAQNGDLPPGTVVSLDGSCDFKIGDKNFECEGKLAYTHFTNGRTQINVLPKALGAVAFSGGKDLQPKPEYYFLTVDRLILSGGTVVPADGFCSIHLRADGQLVYSVEGKALTHDGRVFEFKFTPDPKPPDIFNI